MARPLFKPSEVTQVLISDFGVVLWIAAMYYWVHNYGWNSMLGYHFVPYLWVNQCVDILSLFFAPLARVLTDPVYQRTAGSS
jgi:hypothetical protein